MQLLRKNPSLPFPALNESRVTAATVRQWKMRGRAYDEAQLRLGLVTPAEVQHRNSALRIKPGESRIVRFARHD